MSATDNFDLVAGGVKFDAGKVRMDLVPQDAVFAVACVFTYGAIKYDDWNWAKGMRTGRILAAYDRHKMSFLMGEDIDPESNLPHTWHMLACSMMLVSGQLRGVMEDDRQACLPALYEAQETFRTMNSPLRLD